MAQGYGGYYKGDKVETHSLGKADFNGLLCSVVNFQESDGRVVVELPQSARGAAGKPMPETINVKPENLKLNQAGDERMEAEKQGNEREDLSATANLVEKEKEEPLHRQKEEEEQQPETLKKAEKEQQRPEEEKPQAADRAAYSSRSSSLTVGDNVELHSLSTASLNGNRGKVVSLPQDQGDRVRVDLGKLGIKAFKLENLKLVELTPEELVWKASLAALQKFAFVKVPIGWDPKPVLMGVVSALEPCRNSKRKARIGDIVMAMPVERRISPELGDQPVTLEEVMGGLEKKYPKWSLERRQDHWDRLEKKAAQLESMRCSSTQNPANVFLDGNSEDNEGAWTLERCECARVVKVNEKGEFELENPRGVVSELTACSRFGFVSTTELSKSAGGYVLGNQPNLLPINCRVQTFGLSAAENNGLTGVVENYYKEKGRYEVNFGEKSLALKSSNLLQLTDVKLIIDDDPVDASVVSFNATTSDFSLCVNGESRQTQFNRFILNHTAYVNGSFRHGARIIVHSLAAETSKQWNDCMGEVVGYDKDAQRYQIQVSPSAQLRIKPDNLRYCPL